MQEKNDTGSIHISDEVIAICAANGALNTDGVVGLWGGITEILGVPRYRAPLPSDRDRKSVV